MKNTTVFLALTLCLSLTAAESDSKWGDNSLPRHENKPFFETGFLYWVAKQQGNAYASTGNAITVPGTIDPNTNLTPGSVSSHGKLYEPNTNIEPGFKVGAGINLDHGKWDLFSEYTYLFSKGSGSVSTRDLNTGIIPLFSYTPNHSILLTTTSAVSSGATNFVSSASSGWSLHFNTITLELRRKWEPLNYLTIRPHFGLQGTWQKQHFHATYQVSSFSTFLSAGNNRVLFEQNSWGVGARFGLDGVWKFSRHWGLFIDSAIAALWGQFKAEGKSYDTNQAESYDHVLIANQDYNLYTISPVIEVLIGLQADWSIANKYLLGFQAGWQEQVWLFQNQHGTVVPNSSLILQGLTTKIHFDF